jgi:hypothetical protein
MESSDHQQSKHCFPSKNEMMKYRLTNPFKILQENLNQPLPAFPLVSLARQQADNLKY